ncbi:Veg family protein [Marinilactibacillus sp. GCM10026970]|uniref:Veg family protein n=1 Tax=unclassified Marinilactibacillus TaxID=2632303 RepID=UPI001CE42738|nr:MULTISPECIES: Veg family protein [unclassified Marinilactibacillus]MEC6747940.1 Veg family protein [Marinilactibacillus sp. XAAS-LB27]
MPITIASIKQNLDGQLGKEIKLTAQAGRKKTTERKGILTDTFPAVFIVELNKEENAYERVSYSYADVLTQTVELEFLGSEL